MMEAALLPNHPRAFNSHHEGWKAELELGFADRGDKTVLKHRVQQGPLAIQRPLYPEGKPCHTYLLHPPGGVVGGDVLNIKAETQSGAHALVTTPGATKFYRSEGKVAQQTQTLRVGSDSILEWLPQENIFFPTAQAKLNTQIYLSEKARFMGWEMHCFGRPALEETFTSGAVGGRTEIFLQDKRIFTDHLKMQGQDKLLHSSGLQNFSMTGTFFITSDTPELFEQIQGLLSDIQQAASSRELVIGVTRLESLIVVRALGKWSESILLAFTQIWKTTRQQWLGTTPDIPRIWAT